MKFAVAAGELAIALRGPCDRARPNQTIPILKHVLLDVNEGSLHILGHDLESSSASELTADIAAAGSCAIPAEPLAKLINGLPKHAHVAFETEKTHVIIKSGRSRYKLPILPAQDMPEALAAGGAFRASVTADDLEQLFQRPRSALNLKDERAMCRGVFIHNDAGKLSSVGTSGYTLLRFSTDIDASEFKGVIVPRSAADEILKIGAGELLISDRIISISTDRLTYSSKLIDATYFDYRRIIPPLDIPRTAVDRDAMIEALSRLNAMGNFTDSELIDIVIDNGEMSLKMSGSGDGAELIECTAPDNTCVCLRGGQLIDALKAMKGELIELHITNRREMVRIVDSSEPSAVNIMMPCASSSLPKEKAAAA